MEKVHWKWYPDGKAVGGIIFNSDMIILETDDFGKVISILPFWRQCSACRKAYKKYREAKQ